MSKDVTLQVQGLGLLENDTVGASILTLINGPAIGILLFDGDGSFTYTPDPNANGVDSFTYRLTNQVGVVDQATVSIKADAEAELLLFDMG